MDKITEEELRIDWLIARVEELEVELKKGSSKRLRGPFRCASCNHISKTLSEMNEHHNECDKK